MQEYLIRHHDYIGLLMADLVNIIEVDAIENPSHYCGCFGGQGPAPEFLPSKDVRFTVMERNYVPNLL